MTVAASTTPLSEATGFELSAFKAEHVAERVRRAITREGIAGEDALVALLRRDPAARRRFRRAVAVSHSGLFRDPAQFDLIERELLPRLVDRGLPISVWSAGCANGCELASVAIVLGRSGLLDRARLLGSDLLPENLDEARAGACGEASVAPGLLARMRWEQRDLVADVPPPGRWSLVLCRNVAIYLTREARARLHEHLAAALTHGGILLLGRSERIADPAALGLAPVAAHAYERAA